MYNHHNKDQLVPILLRIIAAIVSLFVITTALNGCAVGPKFIIPKVPISQNWNTVDSSISMAHNTPDSTWWTVFGDSVLNHLVALAYQQNLTLQLAGLKIMEARSQVALAVGSQFPQTQAAFGNASLVGVSKNISDAIGINRNFLNYQMGFDVSWEADLWGKFRRDIQAQTAGFLSTVADYDNALVSLVVEVARTYALIRTYEVLIEQANQNAKLQEDGLHIAQSRFRNGATSELDVSQATTLLENTRASIPQLEISLIQSQNALSTLLGQPTGTVQALLQGPKDVPTPRKEVSIYLPAELLMRRPDVRSAEFLAAAQCARVGIAKSEFYPQLKLSGIISTQSSNGSGVPSANLFGLGSILYAVGPRFVWPILNYGQISNNVRMQDARLQQLLVNYKNTVLKAAQEVEDGLTSYSKARQAAVFAQNAANGAQRSVDLAFIQYREGAVDYERVLDAQRSLLQEQNSLAQARSAIAVNLISLYKALGGGWELQHQQPFVADSTRIEMQHRTNWGNLFSKPISPANSYVPTPNDR